MVKAHEVDIDALCERIGASEGAARVREACEQLDGEDPELLARSLPSADLLAQLRLDPQAVLAALLVDAVEAGLRAREGIVETYGEEVAGLVDGASRLRSMQWSPEEGARDPGRAEAVRKMFLAMAADVRVVIVALALRVRDMRAVRDEAPEERRRFARESLEIFAPLANRLGIFLLKWELEDLALRELEPAIYKEIGKLLAARRAERTASIDEAINVLEDRLSKAGIRATISGRPKHIYSIYRKMQRKQVGFEEIYDVSAVRVIVEKVEECYAALGIVHGLWTPIPGEFDDYIARPKGNGYQSLHTAVAGPGGGSLEVQIRTREMHRFGEYGIAAHWRYKEGGKKERRVDEKFNFLRQLMDWQQELHDPDELVDSLKTDIFQDQVYVFTPTGDVVDLPRGATPVDFAYRIHTSVGHRCRGALVNGQIVPLDHKLETGDRVEILTHKEPRPSRDWLSPQLGYARSPGTRQKIRQWFRQQGREQAIAQGRDLLERELKRAGVGRPDPEANAAALGFRSGDELMAAIGFGTLSTQTAAARLLDAEAAERAAEAPPQVEAAPLAEARAPNKAAASGVSIDGVGDILSTPARCCTPVPGDAVIGYISRGKGVIIHRRDCPNIISHPEPERLLEIDWGAAGQKNYPVTIALDVVDQPGALRDITAVVSDMGINLQSIRSAAGRRGAAKIRLVVEVRSNEQVVRLLTRLERVRSVTLARRIAG
ncbi:MAG: bifunctional (p)ppGpp synthetase/guanosine-3',5'-bis(diphosphate) 3'-pyrophosphohydrolase [Myxococcales bacterium]|nr:bifunctional (p)ppGpp synthetase/guanosine-3',5'-bis(diphosphate) 3'-pyrophosphohydrolase [Myxococcales bacterium]